jgi:sugar O-acyltransferase (sialic acid O-acetyltransferase NeuD family)
LVSDINRRDKVWNLRGFLSDSPVALPGSCEHAILGGRDWLDDNLGCSVAIGIGAPSVRRKIARSLIERQIDMPVLIHPNAVIGSRVSIGQGSLITAGNVLTTDITIGSFVILNLLCTTGHDCRLGSYVTVAPGTNISGNVFIGEGCDVGTGTAIVQGITIGEWTILGAGACATRDVPANCTAVGVPAVPIKSRPPGWEQAGGD